MTAALQERTCDDMVGVSRAVAPTSAPGHAIHAAERERGHLRVVDDAPKFSMLPHDIMRDTSLSRDARLLYAVLQGHWWQGGECWASHATLAAEMGCKERMLRYYLAELINARVISERRRGHGQAKAYSPAQAARDCQLNGQESAALSPKRQPVAGQAATERQLKRQPVADRKRLREEDSSGRNNTPGVVAADAAPAPPAEVKPRRKRVRAKEPSPEETPAPETIELTDVSYASALKMGFDRAAVDFELDRFLAKARSFGWTYVDWKAAFRTWLLNEVKYARQDGRPVGGPAPTRNGVHRAAPAPAPAGSIAARVPVERFTS